MFKGKFEKITETTLGRYQQGGIMAGDIVEIKKNALKHPKVKDMAENLKGNIKMMMDTDLHLTVTGVRSTRDSRGEMSDGLGLASTTSPTDFWIDIAVLHSPGLKSDPVTVPVEIVERIDFGGNLPSIPDSLVRKNNIVIKPEEVGGYDNNKGDKYNNPTKNTKLKESLDDIYTDMSQPDEKEQVTVRVPLEDTDEAKDVFDQFGVTYSVIGTNRYELHGTLDNIQTALNSVTQSCGCDGVDIEYVDGDDELDVTQAIPTITGEPTPEPTQTAEFGDDSLEEAYSNISVDGTPEPIQHVELDDDSLEEAYSSMAFGGTPKARSYAIVIPNAFAENLDRYLAKEGVDSNVSVEGDKTIFNIVSTSDKDAIEESIKSNVMGDLTYLKVYEGDML